MPVQSEWRHSLITGPASQTHRPGHSIDRCEYPDTRLLRHTHSLRTGAGMTLFVTESALCICTWDQDWCRLWLQLLLCPAIRGSCHSSPGPRSL